MNFPIPQDILQFHEKKTGEFPLVIKDLRPARSLRLIIERGETSIKTKNLSAWLERTIAKKGIEYVIYLINHQTPAG